jgi:hypothetical protein
MKKLLLVVLVPLVVSAAALASPNPASATAHCKNLLRKAPTAYTSVSLCVTAQTAAAAQNATDASQKCKAERDGDATAFATIHGGKSFADFYGTNANKKNAFGKCVSA